VNPINLAGVRVLLVDDNDALEIIGSYLRHSGALVTVARNGAEALTHLMLSRVHVVVTDLSMPGLDVEFVSRVRGPELAQPRPPVIAVTTFPDKHDPRRVQDAGLSSYLVKPVDPASVALEVRRIFNRTYSPLGYGDASRSADAST
jgi:CheY-like chemotaxis protein